MPEPALVSVLVGVTLASSLLLAIIHESLQEFSLAGAEALARERGPRPAGRLARLVRDRETLLRFTLFALNFFHLAFAGALFLAARPAAGGPGIWLRLAGIWLVGLVLLGDLLPRRWVQGREERVLLALLPLLAWFSWPARLARPLLKRPEADQEPESDRDEIEDDIHSAVAEGRLQGVLEQSESRMIASILEFREIEAGEIMTPRTEMVAVPLQADFAKVKEIAAGGYSRLPVYDGNRDNIVGVLYVKELLNVEDRETGFSLASLMHPPHFVPATMSGRQLLSELTRARVHIAVVLDEYGGTAGLVTLGDLSDEIFGANAADQPRNGAVLERISEREAIAEGRLTVFETNELLGTRLPEGDNYETLGGLLAARLGHIPRRGERLAVNGAELEVLEAEPRRVLSVRIRRT